MNNSNTPTHQKIMIPLRLPRDLYEQMMEAVHARKKTERGYSANQYLSDLLTKDLGKKK